MNNLNIDIDKILNDLCDNKINIFNIFKDYIDDEVIVIIKYYYLD